MIDNNEALSERLKYLEGIELEYQRLKTLIEDASHDRDAGRLVGDMVLHVDPSTLRILDANAIATKFLGFSKSELQTFTIDRIEVNDLLVDDAQIYIESSIPEQVYNCSYRHRDGYLCPVRVHKRYLLRETGAHLHYRLVDLSLDQQLWHELQRREDAGFQFQQKLKILNEITVELSRIDSYDTLCAQAVRLGVDLLGFDRLSIWFLDYARRVMLGSFGLDESGQLRDERGQSWIFDDTYIMDFLAGKTEPILTSDEAPIYNDRSEIIGYGWHLSVPMFYGEKLVGVLMADNYRYQNPIRRYEPELLRLYGTTIAHLTELVHIRRQAFDMRIDHERAQMLKRFITDVGHDFRTPLSIINTNNYLITRVSDPQRTKDLSAGTQEQVMYLNQMLDDMLELVSLQNELNLKLQPIKIYGLIDEIARTYNIMQAGEQVTWQIVFDEALSVIADAHYFKQALGCVIKNAFQYNHAGGHVTISAVQERDAITISIEDTGIGIDRQYHEQIFKPLFRVDQARTNRGSGLGLSIARLIINAHGGQITVESTPGVGSKFILTLPVHS